MGYGMRYAGFCCLYKHEIHTYVAYLWGVCALMYGGVFVVRVLILQYGNSGWAKINVIARITPSGTGINVYVCVPNGQALYLASHRIPGLTELNLAGLSGVSASGIAYLSFLPALKRLSLARCCQVSSMKTSLLSQFFGVLTLFGITGSAEPKPLLLCVFHLLSTWRLSPSAHFLDLYVVALHR